MIYVVGRSVGWSVEKYLQFTYVLATFPTSTIIGGSVSNGRGGVGFVLSESGENVNKMLRS